MSKKQLKLWVFQNAGGTKRRVDKANKMVDAYLKSNIKAWEEQLMTINKGYIDDCKKEEKNVEPWRLIMPVHGVPAEVYNLIVKELKPMVTNGKFTIYAEFTNVRGLLGMTEIQKQSNKAVAKELVKTK
jgi:hypothetical protein